MEDDIKSYLRLHSVPILTLMRPGQFFFPQEQTFDFRRSFRRAGVCKNAARSRVLAIFSLITSLQITLNTRKIINFIPEIILQIDY